MTAPRRRAAAGALALIGVLVAAVPGAVCAQAPPGPAATRPPEPAVESPTTVVERGPSIFYLPDENGKLQPVVNFPLAEFQRLLTLRDALVGNFVRPQYTLSLSIDGRQRDEHAELSVSATVKLARDGWTRVPLRLAAAALRKPVVHEGPGDHLLEFDATGDGYVVWLQGKNNDIHTLHLALLLPLNQVGDDTRLKLSLPLNEPGRLTFTVAAPDAQATVTPPALVETREATAEGTHLGVVGLAGDMELAWRQRQAHRPDVPTVLKATGTIQLSLDGRTATSEATIVVASAGGGAFDSFALRLPPEADVVTPPRQDFVIVENPATLPDAREGQPRSAGRVLEIKLPQPTTEPVEVRLVTQRPYGPAEPDAWLELAGFEVLGAPRQTGFISVQVVGDWQVIWGPRRGVRQVETLPATLASPTALAGFEYLSQPASLQARVVPRETRLGVEPEYLLLVDDDRVRLEARLRYTIRGAKAFALDVEMPDWEIDEVGPATLLDLNGLVPEQRAPLSLPLLQPTIGEVQVAVRAHRLLSDGAQHVRVRLPRPRANALGPAAVVVLPADNVTLVPRTDEMRGLDRQTIPLPANLPPRQQEPLAFRGDAGELVFAADFRVEPGTISAAVSGELDVREDAVAIDETLTFDIAHEPVESLTLLAPRSLVGNSSLELMIDGEVVKPVSLGSDGSTPPGIERLRLGLPKATIGSCAVRARYVTTEEPLPSGATVMRSWPLIMPGEASLTRCEFKVAARPGIKVQSPGSEWTVAPARPGRRGETVLVAPGPRYELPLALALVDRAPFGGTFVERAWVQSWWAGGAPQERASYALVTREAAIDVELPAEAAAGTVEIRVNGQRVAPTATAQGRLQIALGPAPDNRHRLEFDYRLNKTALAAAPRLRPPALLPEVWVHRLYWELILPPGVHLWSAPGDVWSESQWSWTGLGWARRPSLTSAELEDWVGVAHRAAPPVQAARYLMSVSGPVPAVSATIVHRRTLVFVAAGAALGLGLLLIYLPAARRGWVLLAIGVGLAATASLYPEPTLLAGQAAACGVALAVVAFVLREWTLRRHQPFIPPRPRGSSIIELGSTARQRTAPSSVPSTTEPMHLPEPVGEAQQ